MTKADAMRDCLRFAEHQRILEWAEMHLPHGPNRQWFLDLFALLNALPEKEG